MFISFFMSSFVWISTILSSIYMPLSRLSLYIFKLVWNRYIVHPPDWHKLCSSMPYNSEWMLKDNCESYTKYWIEWKHLVKCTFSMNIINIFTFFFFTLTLLSLGWVSSGFTKSTVNHYSLLLERKLMTYSSSSTHSEIFRDFSANIDTSMICFGVQLWKFVWVGSG